MLTKRGSIGDPEELKSDILASVNWPDDVAIMM
jgi:hypothetical protein